MVRLYIIRHGQTEYNVQKRLQGRADSPLTAKGSENAAALGRYLSDIDFDLVLASPAKRAQRTAEIICSGRNLSILVEEDMREINLGDWEGKTKEELIMKFPEETDRFWNKPHLYMPLEGDSYYDVQERAVNAIKKLVKQHEEGNILIVTHTVVIKSIVAYCKGYSMDRLWEPPNVLDTSITVLEADKNGIRLVSAAETPHLK